MKHDASEGQREGNRGIAVDVGRAERTSENSRGRSRREKIPDVHIKEKWTTAQNSEYSNSGCANLSIGSVSAPASTLSFTCNNVQQQQQQQQQHYYQQLQFQQQAYYITVNNNNSSSNNNNQRTNTLLLVVWPINSRCNNAMHMHSSNYSNSNNNNCNSHSKTQKAQNARHGIK